MAGNAASRSAISPERLRAWWASRQGLLDPGSKAPAEILSSAGWARSVGGAGPYFTLFARGGHSREAVDAAVAALEIHELPSARACTYVLPAAHFPLGLTVAAAAASRASDMKVALKLGVTEKEIDRLCDAVLATLRNGPAEPDEIRAAVGAKARSLGPEGQKKGIASTLPLALGQLQLCGAIRRIPTNGRLDQQRYRYSLWQPNPLQGTRLTEDEAFTALARLYFQWIGPATQAEFQWFSGLGAKAAKEALAPLGLVPMVEGSDRLLFPEDRDRLHAFRMPKEPAYRLVSGLDSMFLLRRDHRTLMDPADAARPVLTAREGAGALSDLPCHAILDRGRLIGMWEYDPSAEEIVWFSYVKPNADLKAAIRTTGDFIRTQLGDARSFSLDSPKSRQPKIEALRAIGKN
jgi:hypothetical protein